MLNDRIRALIPRMRCPECNDDSGQLQLTSDAAICQICSRHYPIRQGIPFLLSSQSTVDCHQELNSQTGQSMQNEYQTIAAVSASPSFITRIFSSLRIPEVLYHPNPFLRKSYTAKLFNHHGSNTSILNIGGGPRRYSAAEITLNIAPFINVDIVGDAHTIPFADNTFDSVICNAVLEHVSNPVKVVAEMIRILKPGGYLYAEVPFIFFYHGYPNDFIRYTREGMRRLFSELNSPVFGISGGPTSCLLLLASKYLTLLVPERLRLLRKLVSGVFRLMTFPLKYLDIILNRHPDAHLLASGIYVLGTKPAV